jgi:hypothetical protein
MTEELKSCSCGCDIIATHQTSVWSEKIAQCTACLRIAFVAHWNEPQLTELEQKSLELFRQAKVNEEEFDYFFCVAAKEGDKYLRTNGTWHKAIAGDKYHYICRPKQSPWQTGDGLEHDGNLYVMIDSVDGKFFCLTKRWDDEPLHQFVLEKFERIPAGELIQLAADRAKEVPND